MNTTATKFLGYLVPVVFVFAITDCGGGGGGGDFVGAAQVSITAEPTRIDTGDRTLVRANLTEVNENGISLKFRVPNGLTYVRDSSFLSVGGQKVNLGPTVNEEVGAFRYVVFFIQKNLFSKDATGDVTLQFEGAAEVIDGRIEVDPDVDDPLIDNSVEFDLQNPEFVAEDSIGIHVQAG